MTLGGLPLSLDGLSVGVGGCLERSGNRSSGLGVGGCHCSPDGGPIGPPPGLGILIWQPPPVWVGGREPVTHNVRISLYSVQFTHTYHILYNYRGLIVLS